MPFTVPPFMVHGLHGHYLRASEAKWTLVEAWRTKRWALVKAFFSSLKASSAAVDQRKDFEALVSSVRSLAIPL